jgi:hypothetical protein
MDFALFLLILWKIHRKFIAVCYVEDGNLSRKANGILNAVEKVNETTKRCPE